MFIPWELNIISLLTKEIKLKERNYIVLSLWENKKKLIIKIIKIDITIYI